ncbi:LacI family DNA-binding transcriptional regulator [Novosphingobium resinovorum]|uniref:LacI family DNA-binding transcriptional regulator n=1 Tax=Novosphingobium resinovorum TaxID=158500 RepID=UPI002ED2B102|nr:LacI family DNA-binding transcriptional regulator [Novosphingobium resinovorum]
MPKPRSTKKLKSAGMEDGRRPTSYDVARIAGVSQSAVSRCFAPNASIAPAKRELILKVAAEIGYKPNALAQALISRRTNIVAVIISARTNFYYPEVLAELGARLSDKDFRVLLFALSQESEVDGVLDQIWRHSVDGVISAARLSPAQVAQFTEHRVPVVLYNRVASGAASVRCDSVEGERDLVGRLLAAGHRRFGLISGPQDNYVAEERRGAALMALMQGGVTQVPEVRGDFTYESGRAAMRELHASGCEAVVSVNDMMAIGAMDAARIDLGLSVPQDLSIVGFDGSGASRLGAYDLTTVRQPVRRMTDAAIELLVKRIEDASAPPEQRLFSGSLERGSSARIAEQSD